MALDLVYVNNTTVFIDHIIKKCVLDEEKVLIRIRLDRGQDSFKVFVSIFETDYDPEVTFSKSEGPGTRL